MKTEYKCIYFISINPFSYLPMMRFLIPGIGQMKSCVISSVIKGYSTPGNNVKTEPLCVFDSKQHFDAQSSVDKIVKYARLCAKILKILFSKENNIIYTVDYQVLAIILLFKSIFRKNIRIVYHQFELFEPEHSSFPDKYLQKIVLKYVQHIYLTVFPEVNRAEYFKQISNYPQLPVYIIPNTNSCYSVEIKNGIHQKNIFSKKKIVGYVGHMGTSHYALNYLKFIAENKNIDCIFLFIGRIESEISMILAKAAEIDSRIVITGELSHDDLLQYYKNIDVGIILYKGVNKNVEWCAPNKLYEYWSFGIPVLAHQLKGLRDIWFDPHLGELVDFENPSTIESGLKKLLGFTDEQREELRNIFKDKLTIEKYLPLLELSMQA